MIRYPYPTAGLLTIDGRSAQTSIRMINILAGEVVPWQNVNGKTQLTLRLFIKGPYVMKLVSEEGVRKNKQFLVH